MNERELNNLVDERSNTIAEIEKKRIPTEDKVAYIGLCCVQLALLPSFFSTDLPHFSLPLMVFLGLICYQYRAWVQRDMV